MPDILPGQTEMEEQEPDRQEEEHGESVYFARWTDRYKEAREYLYGTMEAEPDEEAAHEIMLEEAEQECVCHARHGKDLCTGHWM